MHELGATCMPAWTRATCVPAWTRGYRYACMNQALHVWTYELGVTCMPALHELGLYVCLHELGATWMNAWTRHYMYECMNQGLHVCLHELGATCMTACCRQKTLDMQQVQRNSCAVRVFKENPNEWKVWQVQCQQGTLFIISSSSVVLLPCCSPLSWLQHHSGFSSHSGFGLYL